MPAARDRIDPWEPGVTYVIGHQRPDTDAIASALSYAWYLSETGWENVRAARAGQPVEETAFALDRFGQAPPGLLTGVAPTFGHAAQRQAALNPAAPLSDAMAQLAEGARVVAVVDAEGQPLGAVTPMALARAYAGPGSLGQPCQGVLEKPLTFPARERISDHRRAVVRSDGDEFLVVDGAGLYIGVALRGRVLEPPRAQIILVDHNELSQAISGADEADIVAVLDHHRLANPATAAPIPFVVEPVGCTCTLVAARCRMRNLQPPAPLAGMMLSGILSDTLVFRSPTTTERDRGAADWLAELLKIDVESYGEELLRASPGLKVGDVGHIVDEDRKAYEIGGDSVSIAQVEVPDMRELPHRRDELLAALEERRQREGLALACLMVTDVVAGRSRLLCQGENRILAALPFHRAGANEFDLGDVVSRKKQLVPALYDVLEGGP
jgi:manganese-dependent inorganic pyrophosphatase